MLLVLVHFILALGACVSLPAAAVSAENLDTGSPVPDTGAEELDEG